MLCTICQKPIEPERLEVLPNTTLCAACARKNPPPRKVGVMEYAHKTAPELVFLNPEDLEEMRRAERAANRSR